MKRFFYTDPLAAAWMMSHFGMRFANHNNGIEITLENILRHALTGNVCGIHIHSDSIPLLKPRQDDVVLIDDLEGANSVEFWSDERKKGKLIMIIQREGIAFHWPHSEDA